MNKFYTIKSSIKSELRKLKNGCRRQLAGYGNRSKSSIRREADRLHKYFDGIRARQVPAALFVVRTPREPQCRGRGAQAKVPVVAFVDIQLRPPIW